MESISHTKSYVNKQPYRSQLRELFRFLRGDVKIIMNSPKSNFPLLQPRLKPFQYARQRKGSLNNISALPSAQKFKEIPRFPSQKIQSPSKNILSTLSERKMRRSLELREKPVVTEYIGERSVLDITSIMSTVSDPKQVIKIKLLSNWGHKSLINLSSVCIMSGNLKVIPEIVGTIPALDDPKPLEYLFTNSMIKGDNEEMFTTKWPVDDDIDNSFTIICIVPYGMRLSLIRVWNGDANQAANAKDIEIKIASYTMFKGEIPYKFGIDFAIPDFYDGDNAGNENIISKTDEKEVAVPQDSFGIFSFPKVFTITFEIVETFSNDNFFGINGFDIYDHNMNPVFEGFLRRITITGCNPLNEKRTLFRPNKISNSQDLMFLAEKTGNENPKIEIILKTPIDVALIVVWNFNFDQKCQFYRGIKRLKVNLSQKRFGRALIKKADGQIHQIVDKTTNIWFTDYIPSHKAFKKILHKQRQIEYEEDMKLSKIEE